MPLRSARFARARFARAREARGTVFLRYPLVKKFPLLD